MNHSSNPDQNDPEEGLVVEQKDTNTTDEDLLKWERMYYGVHDPTVRYTNRNDGHRYDRYEISMENSQTRTGASRNSSSQIRVITFDLDNTLWKTTPVISSANDALDMYLKDRNKLHVPTRVEIIMKQLFETNPTRYGPNQHALNVPAVKNGETSTAKSSSTTVTAPVLLTLLRKDAIRQILVHNYGDTKTKDSLDTMIDEAFQYWSKARHDAIPHNLAQEVVQHLQELRTLQTSQGYPVILGAITDGNSDPRNVGQLQDFFDFCIHAENVGVAKPDKRVYLAAVQHYLKTSPFLQDIFIPGSNLEDDDFSDRIGPWWVHVGDDFLKDVVASKEINIRSIWYREFIKDNINSVDSNKKEANRDVKVSEVQSRSTDVNDYLLNSLQNDFADSIVDSFQDLRSILFQWHQEGTLLDSNHRVPSR